MFEDILNGFEDLEDENSQCGVMDNEWDSGLWDTDTVWNSDEVWKS